MGEPLNAETINGQRTVRIKGNTYSVSALPLKFILGGYFGSGGIALPNDAADPGQNQLYNLSDETRRGKIDELLKLLVTKDRDAMSLEKAAGDDWDLSDIGWVLLQMAQLSGL